MMLCMQERFQIHKFQKECGIWELISYRLSTPTDPLGRVHGFPVWKPLTWFIDRALCTPVPSESQATASDILQ